MSPEINAVEVLIRLVASLGMVVAIILVAAKVLRRRGGLGFGLGLGRNDDGPRLDVLDRTTLSRGSSVAVVRVGGRGLIVGVTEQQVTLLTEAPELIDRYESARAPRPVADAPLNSIPMNTEAERTAPPVELDRSGRHDAGGPILGSTVPAQLPWSSSPDVPEPARMNFFEALREATVRRS